MAVDNDPIVDSCFDRCFNRKLDGFQSIAVEIITFSSRNFAQKRIKEKAILPITHACVCDF